MALRTPAFNDAKTYGFEWLRAIAEAHLQEGVLASGDLKVTAAAGGGMKVDIAAGAALVKGDSGVAGTGLTQGLFYIVNDASVANAVTLTNADPTNPRIDQIVLRARDSSDLGSGADDSVFEVVTGTPTSGATLDNRTGAPALPNDRVRLADVLVPAGSSSTTNGNIRDRRPWARGARRIITRNANAAAGNDYTTTSATFVAIDATNLTPRIECSGAPLRLALRGVAFHSVSGDWIDFQWRIDATQIDGGEVTEWRVAGVNLLEAIEVDWELAPAAGSHLFAPYWATQAATATLRAQAGVPMQIAITEDVRQNAENT